MAISNGMPATNKFHPVKNFANTPPGARTVEVFLHHSYINDERIGKGYLKKKLVK